MFFCNDRKKHSVGLKARMECFFVLTTENSRNSTREPALLLVVIFVEFCDYLSTNCDCLKVLLFIESQRNFCKMSSIKDEYFVIT